MGVNRINNKFSRKKKIGKTAPKTVSKHDQYLAVWILQKLKWSPYRIAKLKLPSSHHTIEKYFAEACELIESGELQLMPCRKGDVDFVPIGNATDVEYTNALIHQNPCGGGKKVKKHHYGSDWIHNGVEAFET